MTLIFEQHSSVSQTLGNLLLCRAKEEIWAKGWIMTLGVLQEVRMKGLVNPHFLSSHLFGGIRTSKSQSLPHWQGIVCPESQGAGGQPQLCQTFCRDLLNHENITKLSSGALRKDRAWLRAVCCILPPFPAPKLSASPIHSLAQFFQFLKSIFPG